MVIPCVLRGKHIMTITADELRLLSQLLGTPEEESLKAIEELADAYPWLQPGAAELAGITLGEWQAEHTRLFISGFPTTVCPPFASARRHGCMGGSVVEELHAFYERCGLQSEGLPEDYLGTMLECAAWLQEQGTQQSQELLSELWQQHLVPWLPEFGRKLADESRLGLYRDLGRQLRELASETP
jgi:TorA maturation chaperone TorD